jgi:ATP-binding cassette subfamily B protein
MAVTGNADFVFTALIIILNGCNIFLNRFNSFIYSKILPNLKKNMFLALNDCIINKPYTYFKQNITGVLSSKICEVITNAVDIIYLVFFILYQILAILLGLFFVGLSNIFFSEIFCLVIFLSIFSGFFIVKMTMSLSLDFIDSRSNYIAALSDFINNIKDFKLNNLSPLDCKVMSGSLGKLVHKDKLMQRKSAVNLSLLGLCAFFLEAGTILGVLFLLNTKKISLGDSVFVILMSLKLTEQIWSLSDNFFYLVKSISCLKEGLEFLGVNEKNISFQTKISFDLPPKIQLTNVGFSYRKNNIILNNVNLKINHGEKLAITGPSGSGKSTLINVIAGLIELSNGKILINDIDLNLYNINLLRKNITFIHQDSSLLNRSIKDNLTLGCEFISQDNIIKAAKAACIHDDITNLKDGYDTVVGENGFQPSGGQRQRLLIARAFLKNSPLIIMDEPTSALDCSTEVKVVNAIINWFYDNTLIVSTHSKAFISLVDKVFYTDA